MFFDYSVNFQIILFAIQFSSVAQLCLTLCDPMNRPMPTLPVHHQLPQSTQTHVHPTISSSTVPFSSCPQYFPASGSFPMSQLFASGGQSIRVSASTSVLPIFAIRYPILRIILINSSHSTNISWPNTFMNGNLEMP